jgi:hypothetical protein
MALPFVSISAYITAICIYRPIFQSALNSGQQRVLKNAISFQWVKVRESLINLERETGIEPATFSLGNRRSIENK